MEKIIALGTGCGITVKCYSLSFILKNDNKYLLVDTGSGNELLSRLNSKGITINKIHDIFISHKHIDHMLGIIPFIRKMCQEVAKGKYEGSLNIYCNKEIKEIIDTFLHSTFHESHEKIYKDQVKYHFLENNLKINVLDYNLEVMDVYSKECLQYGFKMELQNKKALAFLGDIPCNEKNYEKIKNIDWCLHEAMCLESEEPIFKAKEKSHSLVADVAKMAQELNIKNLVLWHTVDNNILIRKQLYTKEAKQYFKGNIFVPNDLDEINL